MRWRPLLPLTLPQRFLAVFAGLLLVLVLLSALFAGRSAREQLADLRQQAARLPALTALARQAYSEGQHAAFETHLREVAASLPLRELRLTGEEPHPLFRYTRDTPALPLWLYGLIDEAELELRQPVMLNAQVGAELLTVLSPAPIAAAALRVFTHGFVLAILFALVFAALTVRLRAQITAPLRQLSGWCRNQIRGITGPPPALPAHCREVRELVDALAQTATALGHHRLGHDEARDLLAHREQQLQHLTDGLREVVLETDALGRLRHLNTAWVRLTGFPLEQSVNRPLADYILQDPAHNTLLAESLSELPDGEHEFALQHRSGDTLWVRFDVRRQHDAQGRFIGLTGSLTDVTPHRKLAQMLDRHHRELQAISMVDSLTGLPNRRHFDLQLESMLAGGRSGGGDPVSLLLIDLDGFKFINDIYGHPIGDEALRTTARLLRGQVREHDFIARLAGDEFAMILHNTDLAHALVLARELHALIAATRLPLPLGDMSLRSSIGIAEAPTHGHRPDELMRAADVALYHSKRQGRNRVEALTPDASRATMSVFSQGFTLRQALEHGNLRPAFQPIFDIQSGREVAREVLARMRLKDTVVQAKDFITIAEELGLTRELDLHIIDQALRLTPADQALFLNVDLSSFVDRHFVEELIALLEPARRAGRAITIEITEREAVSITDTLLEDIQCLRNIGCKLALDDFGSGYSTYYFLDQFRPDYLKIEGSFVRAMLESEAARKIVTHIHELALSFGMETIAENVENEAIREALADIGIRNVQGWLYGEPQLMAH
jgi:diguanylate cyclase (GGDEF)-like protein/PAS domain S-box-containing protein